VPKSSTKTPTPTSARAWMAVSERCGSPMGRSTSGRRGSISFRSRPRRPPRRRVEDELAFQEPCFGFGRRGPERGARATLPARWRASAGARRRRRAARPPGRTWPGSAASARREAGGSLGRCVGGCRAPRPGRRAAPRAARTRRKLIGAAVQTAAGDVDEVLAPLGVDERARREAWQPPPLVAGQLAEEPQGAEELVLVDAGRPQLEAADHTGQQLATRGAGGIEQQVEVAGPVGDGDPRGPGEILAQPLEPDPPADQPQDVDRAGPRRCAPAAATAARARAPVTARDPDQRVAAPRQAPRMVAAAIPGASPPSAAGRSPLGLVGSICAQLTRFDLRQGRCWGSVE
jgi:hypothetical protein